MDDFGFDTNNEMNMDSSLEDILMEFQAGRQEAASPVWSSSPFSADDAVEISEGISEEELPGFSAPEEAPSAFLSAEDDLSPFSISEDDLSVLSNPEDDFSVPEEDAAWLDFLSGYEDEGRVPELSSAGGYEDLVSPEEEELSGAFVTVPDAPLYSDSEPRLSSYDLFDDIDLPGAASSPSLDAGVSAAALDKLFLNFRSTPDSVPEGSQTQASPASPAAAGAGGAYRADGQDAVPDDIGGSADDDALSAKSSRVGAMADEARRYVEKLRKAPRRQPRGRSPLPESGSVETDMEPVSEEPPLPGLVTAPDDQPPRAASPESEASSFDFESLLREYSSPSAPLPSELSDEAQDEAVAPSPASSPEGAAAADEPEIDGRFNLSGRRKTGGIVFGSKAVDMTADENYQPTVQTEASLFHWISKDEDAEPVDDNGGRRKSKKKEKALAREEMLRKQKQSEESVAEGFDDEDAEPAEYASGFEEEHAKKYDHDESYFPPTFREYLSSLVASLFLRVRGSSSAPTNYTMEDDSEELGAELSPAAASKYYGSFIRAQRLRLRISAGLLVLLCYLSIGLPVPGMFNYLPTAAAACCALQFSIMLLSLDVVTNAVLNVFRLKLGADGLAVFSCLLTSFDALLVALVDSAALHMPLCALSSLSLFGAALSSSLSTRGIRKALRVPAIGKHFFSVTGEIKFKDKQLTLLKSLRSAKGFVRRAEEAPPDETLFLKLSPLLLFLVFLLSLVLAAVTKSFSDFIYIFSALLAPAVPLTALMAFSLPFFLGTSRIFKSGAAIAGWSGLCDIGMSKSLIVTDRDLFPESSISMENVRVFANEPPEKIISYAGTLICASGSCLSGRFSRLMEKNGCTMQKAENFEYLSGGGMRALIDGHVVLCGSTDLMRLMNVRIPYRLTSRTSVLLAIDGTLCGIFSIKYTPLPKVRKSLVELVRSSRHPVFAVRDFNITPEMLHTTFDLATDGYDFPPYVERFSLSEPSKIKAGKGKIAAILCNEGLDPLTDVADVGRSMYLVTRINVVISALSALLGAFAVFFRLLSVGSVTAGYLLLLMLVLALPVFLVSLYVLKP